ncbi:MAG TPA: mercuric reductase [Gemmatimonadaceae bacterium]|nr:mercuric reductase [Gemmatimonadaceae bacterium]
MTDRYDVVIIGAGQAGVPLAAAFADAGRRTALIERAHVGGTCVNEGCTPTKTLVASGRVAYLARRAGEYGVRAAGVGVDMTAVHARMAGVVERFRTGGENRLATHGVTLVRGDARYLDARTIAVGDLRIETPLSVIDTGGRPARPAISGLDTAYTLDSTSMLDVETLPEHLVIVGGGYIGCEFAQMFRRFGSAVTIIARGALLSGEDPDVVAALTEIMVEDGIEVIRQARVVSISPGRVTLADRTVEGSHILVATGRVPNTETLGLSAAGVAVTPAGFIKVTDTLVTTVPGIYATGDVTGEPQFTHVSYDDFRILKTNLIDGGQATTTGRLVPYTIFTDPQLGRVGLTETAARAAGHDVVVATLPMTSVARAIETGETRGQIKAVVNRATSRILGVAVLGIEGGEIMGAFQIAMMGNLPYQRLRDAIFAHPTTLESLNNLFASL